MSRPEGETLVPGSQPPTDDRLDSWKEIAAYLHRDVRTVQRWEKYAGMPVHRHADARLRTAYAYRSELDVWWRTQRSAPDVDTAEAPAPLRGRRRPAALAAAAVVVVIAAVIATVYFSRFRAREPADATPAATVVLTRFDDQTGDPALAALVEEAVARQLGSSRRVDLVPPAHVNRLLRLMRRDGNTPVTAAIGRELSIRHGGVSATISGRVHKLPGRYFVDLQAIDPVDGRVRISVEGQAADRQALLTEAARSAAQLTNDLIAMRTTRSPADALEQVTTASLPALRLYTSAVQAGSRRQWGASELLARRAIAVDADFASAYAWAAWAMRQQGRRQVECAPLVDRAAELSASASDREVYFIAGIRNLIAGNLPSAVASYEALLRLQPRDRLTLDLIIEAYARSGRIKDAVDMSVARGSYEPADFYANVRAAHALVVWQGDRRRASPFVQRAQELAVPAAVAERPRWAAWLSALPVFDAWIAGNHKPAFEALAALEHGLDSRLGRERDAFATSIGFSYLAFGRLRQARSAFHHAGAPVRQMALAMLALASGDEQTARSWLKQISSNSALRPALFARVGLIAEAENGLENLLPSEHADGIAEVTRGLIAARRGETENAVAALRRGVELLRFSGEPEYFLGVEALANIWAARGQIGRAADWLDDASAQRARTYGAGQWTAGAWIGVNGDLLRICRRHGRREQAQRLTTLLKQTLQDADEQHRLAKSLRSGGS